MLDGIGANISIDNRPPTVTKINHGDDVELKKLLVQFSMENPRIKKGAIKIRSSKNERTVNLIRYFILFF